MQIIHNIHIQVFQFDCLKEISIVYIPNLYTSKREEYQLIEHDEREKSQQRMLEFYKLAI